MESLAGGLMALLELPQPHLCVLQRKVSLLRRKKSPAQGFGPTDFWAEFFSGAHPRMRWQRPWEGEQHASSQADSNDWSRLKTYRSGLQLELPLHLRRAELPHPISPLRHRP